MRDLRVVMDAANGMAGLFLPPALERLAIDAVPFFLDLDGTFPNHEPNPLLPENREFVIGKVREEGADLGIAFDGDADRCFFIDDAGEFVPGDFLTALLAAAPAGARGPGDDRLRPARLVGGARHDHRRRAAPPDMWRVGHAFIKRRMREVDALFAGEVSGHYYFRDFSYADSGLIPALLVMEMVATRGAAAVGDDRRLPRALPRLRRDQLDGRGRGRPRSQRLRERYADGRQIEIDGLSVEYEDWHFNVRPSNTEPLLRLNLESLVSEEDMERRRDEVLEVIRSG